MTVLSRIGRVWRSLAGQLAVGFAVVSITTIGIVVLALDRLTGVAFAEYVRHVDAMRDMMSGATPVPVPDPAEFTDSLRRSLMIAGVGGAALSIIAGLAVARLVTRPIRLVEAAADRIARGDTSARTPVTGSTELQHLVEAFNQMGAALHASSIARKDFLAAVAHELRTPLAVLQAEIEALQDGVLDPDAERIEALAEEVRLMGRIVGDLQVLAVADAGELRMDRAPEPVGALLDQAASSLVEVAAAKGVTIRVNTEPSLPPVFVDALRVRQILTNLLVNAIRHSPRDGAVAIHASLRPEDAVEIAVRDEGAGIPAEDAQHIFDRFYRGASVRSEGSGLGLAIVRELVEAHGGTVEASSLLGGGACFVLTLPTTASRVISAPTEPEPA